VLGESPAVLRDCLRMQAKLLGQVVVRDWLAAEHEAVVAAALRDEILKLEKQREGRPDSLDVWRAERAGAEGNDEIRAAVRIRELHGRECPTGSRAAAWTKLTSLRAES
jgi:hypothetical protein